MTDSILLVTVDCLRADHINAYGYDRETTPTIDTIAAEGTQYTNAFSNGPGTRFAFKSLNGGVYPLRISGTGLPRRSDMTVAEALSEGGYNTAGFANNPFLTSYFNHHRGYNNFLEVEDWEHESESTLNILNEFAANIHNRLSGGIVHRVLKTAYEQLLTTAESRGASVGADDAVLVDRAREWIQAQEGTDKPYFIWVHLMDVHGPHQFHAQARESLNIETGHIRDLSANVKVGEEPPQPVIDTYDSSIHHTDQQIRRLLEIVSPDTNVILTADHGEEFGRHGHFHTPSTYQSMAHVPLVARGEAFPKKRVSRPVSHVDVAKTILDLAGVDPDGTWDGQSLVTDANGGQDVYIGFETEDTVMGAVVSYPWKYVLEAGDLRSDPTLEEVYDLKEDPQESTNQREKIPERFASLSEAWTEHLRQLRAHRLDAQRDVWDPSYDLRQEVQNGKNGEKRNIEKQLEHLGYK